MNISVMFNLLAIGSILASKAFAIPAPSITSFIDTDNFEVHDEIGVSIQTPEFIRFYQPTNVEGDTPKEMADNFLEYHLSSILLKGVTASDFVYVSSFKSSNLWNTVRYTQMYDNVPVYGTSLEIYVNEQNEVAMVMGRYMNGVSLTQEDAKSGLTKEEVVGIAKEHYGNVRIYKYSIVIFQSSMGESILAWDVHMQINDTPNSMQALIAANDGVILQEIAGLYLEDYAYDENIYNESSGLGSSVYTTAQSDDALEVDLEGGIAISLLEVVNVEGDSPQEMSSDFLANHLDALNIHKQANPNDFKYVNSKSKIVQYVQVYNGLPVYGSWLEIFMNEENNVYQVIGTFFPELSEESIDINPILTKENIEIILSENYDGNLDLFSAKEVLLPTNKGNVLSWELQFSVIGEDGDGFTVEGVLTDNSRRMIIEKKFILANPVKETDDKNDHGETFEQPHSGIAIHLVGGAPKVEGNSERDVSSNFMKSFFNYLNIDGIATASDFEYSYQSGPSSFQYVQVYEGLPVYEGFLKITVQNERKVTSVSGSYIPDIMLEDSLKVPTLSYSEVRSLVSQNFGEGSESLRFWDAKPVIFRSYSETILAWAATFTIFTDTNSKKNMEAIFSDSSNDLIYAKGLIDDFETQDDGVVERIMEKEDGIPIMLISDLEVPIKGSHAGEVTSNFLKNHFESLNIGDIAKPSDFEYEGMTEKASTYRYKQIFKDTPVYDGSLDITINEKNQITSVEGTYIPKVSIEDSALKTKMMEYDVRALISDKYGKGSGSLRFWYANAVIFQSTKRSILSWAARFSVVSSDASGGFDDFEVVFDDSDGAELYMKALLRDDDEREDKENDVTLMTLSEGVDLSLVGGAIPGKGSNPEEVSYNFLVTYLNSVAVGGVTDIEFQYVSTRSPSIWSTVRYQQVYQNVKVYGSTVDISVNANNDIVFVSGSYTPYISLASVLPQQAGNDLQNIIAKKYGEGSGSLRYWEEELTVFPSGKNSFLSWRVRISIVTREQTRSLEVVINDSTGDVIYEVNLTQYGMRKLTKRLRGSSHM